MADRVGLLSLRSSCTGAIFASIGKTGGTRVPPIAGSQTHFSVGSNPPILIIYSKTLRRGGFCHKWRCSKSQRY